MRPRLMEIAAALPDPIPKMLAHTAWHQELRVLGPSVTTLGEPHLFLAEWLAMGIAGIVLVGGSIADMAIDDDEGRHPLGARNPRSRPPAVTSLASAT